MRHFLFSAILLCLSAIFVCAQDAPQRRRWPRREAFQVDTPMVHDPVMAWENGTFYLYSTGLQLATSKDRKTWTVHPDVKILDIPAWTRDSVPGFRGHVWAPDVINYRGRWWMAYSCSTFGRNTSAIGLASSPTLNFADTLLYHWQDEGCLVCSREHRDQWNAIDPAFILDEQGSPWLTWGSFWDGIQLVRLDPETMHVAEGCAPKTIARRIALRDTLSAEPNPTSRHAGCNAIEAPFIIRHGGYFYLFASHDYCCRGMQSNYKVVVGRSRSVEGPYLDRKGRDMAQGGGTLVIEGDKVEFEAAGHSAFYHVPSGVDTQGNMLHEDLFICHGYSTRHHGQAILIQRTVEWDEQGWPVLKE